MHQKKKKKILEVIHHISTLYNIHILEASRIQNVGIKANYKVKNQTRTELYSFISNSNQCRPQICIMVDRCVPTD